MLNRPLIQREEMAVIAVAYMRLAKSLDPPTNGAPWRIPLEQVAKLINSESLDDRTIGRRIRKMPNVWSRLDKNGRRIIMVPSEATAKDLIPWTGEKGRTWESQIPPVLMVEAREALEAKWEDIKPREEISTADMKIRAELWAQMTPEQKEAHQEAMKDKAKYFGTRGGF